MHHQSLDHLFALGELMRLFPGRNGGDSPVIKAFRDNANQTEGCYPYVRARDWPATWCRDADGFPHYVDPEHPDQSLPLGKTMRPCPTTELIWLHVCQLAKESGRWTCVVPRAMGTGTLEGTKCRFHAPDGNQYEVPAAGGLRWSTTDVGPVAPAEGVRVPAEEILLTAAGVSALATGFTPPAKGQADLRLLRFYPLRVLGEPLVAALLDLLDAEGDRPGRDVALACALWAAEFLGDRNGLREIVDARGLATRLRSQVPNLLKTFRDAARRGGDAAKPKNDQDVRLSRRVANLARPDPAPGCRQEADPVRQAGWWNDPDRGLRAKDVPLFDLTLRWHSTRLEAAVLLWACASNTLPSTATEHASYWRFLTSAAEALQVRLQGKGSRAAAIRWLRNVYGDALDATAADVVAEAVVKDKGGAPPGPRRRTDSVPPKPPRPRRRRARRRGGPRKTPVQ